MLTNKRKKTELKKGQEKKSYEVCANSETSGSESF